MKGVEICAPSEILALNNNKEYVITASVLLEALLTDTNLTAHSAKLWQYLYNKAKFNADLSIEIAYATLAKVFGKSIRTLQRYTKVLENSGYLTIEQIYHHSGGQSANRFILGAPTILLKTAMQHKDRNKNSEMTKVNSVTKDKIVTPGDDNVVTPNINNKKAITNNNKSLVVYSKDKNIPQKALITSLEQKREQLNKLWEQQTQRRKRTELLIKIGELTSAIEIEKQRYELHQKKSLAAKEQAETLNKISLDKNYIAKLNGNRPVKPQMIERMLQSIQQSGYEKHESIKLINEVIYEARFGSLRVNQQTAHENSIERSINIGLKLIREQRWQTPQDIVVKTKILNKNNVLRETM